MSLSSMPLATSLATAPTSTLRCANCSRTTVRSTTCSSTAPTPGTTGRGHRTGTPRGCWRWCARSSPPAWSTTASASPATWTPEQYQPAEPIRDEHDRPVRWEACHPTNGAWGYDRDNLEFKSPDLLLRMLVDTVATGGNLLLNIGPDGRGGLRREDTEALAAMGEWMTLHHGSVQGAGPVDPALG